MNGLKLAVIGAGHLGRIHARLIAAQQQVFSLVGIADPIRAARESLAAEFDCVAYEHHLAVADQVQAAVVATPTAYHHRVAKDLIERGVHVLVEKPLAATLAEADDLVQTARRRGVILQVGHVERFNPVLPLIEAELDQPRYIDAVRCGPFSFRSTDVGAVLDLMIHDIDLALHWARCDVRHVEAIGHRVLGRHEDMANARLTFDNGCVANLTASRVSYTAVRRMHVYTRDVFAGIDFAQRTARLVRRGDRLQRQGEIDFEALSPKEKASLQANFFQELLPTKDFGPAEGNAIADELADFADSIRKSRPPYVSGEAGRAALAVAERIVEAIAVAAAPQTASILQGHHWRQRPERSATKRREAG